MAEFQIISPFNTVLPLIDNDYFHLIEVDSQTGFNASISSNKSSGYDGANVNSLSTDPRAIVITLQIKQSVDVEEAKRYIFSYIKPKQKHTIIWNRNKRELSIEGYCENATMPRWENGVKCQITFFCEQPYWEDIDAVIQEISDVIPLHYFTVQEDDMLYFDADGIVMGEYDLARTRNYYNSGDVSVGVEIVINALKTVTNPVIYSAVDKYIGADITLAAGEKIIITTHKGNKDITKDGVSIIDKLRQGSSWLQLETGENTFTINSDEEATDNMYFEIIYSQRYV